ncbi:hypothetical protein NQ317_005971 [Molorchus minor]|uniref:Uncharacterized protein n=1 Tax=Molorchus minor TaxID=1323400 RepID=A0ABQ9IWV1_9CUCU|nr:hypothetical protein NQ317_005971 [Molorchus minor]
MQLWLKILTEVLFIPIIVSTGLLRQDDPTQRGFGMNFLIQTVVQAVMMTRNYKVQSIYELKLEFILILYIVVPRPRIRHYIENVIDA